MARSTESTETAERTRRNPAEIAQAELDAAEKRFEKASDRQARANEAKEKADADVARAQRFLDFAKANPDLPSEAGSSEPDPETVIA